MSALANVIESSSWVSDADRGDEAGEADADASRAGTATSGHRGLVQSVHVAATLLGLGVPSSRLS